MTEAVSAQWQAELDARGWVEFHLDRAAAFKMVAFATLMAALGAILIVTGSIVEQVVGAIAAAIAALGLSVSLARFVTGKPTVRVDDAGVTCGKQRVKWDEVVGVTTWSAGRGTASVVIKVTEEAAQRLRSGLDPLRRVMEPANRKILRGPSMALPVLNGFDPEVMAAWLKELWSARRN